MQKLCGDAIDRVCASACLRGPGVFEQRTLTMVDIDQQMPGPKPSRIPACAQRPLPEAFAPFY